MWSLGSFCFLREVNGGGLPPIRYLWHGEYNHRHISVLLPHLNIQGDCQRPTYAGVLLPLSKEPRTGVDSQQMPSADRPNETNEQMSKGLCYQTGPKAPLSVCLSGPLQSCGFSHLWSPLFLGEISKYSYPHFTGGETEAPGTWPD